MLQLLSDLCDYTYIHAFKFVVDMMCNKYLIARKESGIFLSKGTRVNIDMCIIVSILFYLLHTLYCDCFLFCFFLTTFPLLFIYIRPKLLFLPVIFSHLCIDCLMEQQRQTNQNNYYGLFIRCICPYHQIKYGIVSKTITCVVIITFGALYL